MMTQQRICGSYSAVHNQWNGILTFYEDGTFTGGGRDPNGTWNLEHGRLLICWYSWPSEVLYEKGDGVFEGDFYLTAVTNKPRLHLQSMFGIGDNIFHIAVLRELMLKYDVTLVTPYVSMYHDLVAQGLKTKFEPRDYTTSLEPDHKIDGRRDERVVTFKRLDYSAQETIRCGSILAAQFASVGLQMPERPDYSMTVPQEWRDKFRAMIGSKNKSGKPLMVYRPIIRNKFWDRPSRAPDPLIYSLLYQHIRDKFFVVSIANLATGKEWIVGPEQDVDLRFHHGELDFKAMAALFAEADLAFVNPGFAPVLAQSVGTAVVVVYGGNESSRTTQAPGFHLAPILCIEPDRPCDCHSPDHLCDKTITEPSAIEKLDRFIEEQKRQPMKTLIFATTYIDSEQRRSLLDLWLTITRKLNPYCDILIVDSASPLQPIIDSSKHGLFVSYDPSMTSKQMLHSFQDNIGHLSRGGRDGWGRAFCFGLQAALDGQYEYVVHIEGDSLFRLPVMPIVQQMKRTLAAVVSTEVRGTPRVEHQWVETGLMAFETAYVRGSNFIDKYDWANRSAVPTPENVIWNILGPALKLMAWRTQRSDCGQITVENVEEFDWITHVMGDEGVCDAFLASLDRKIKLNFGCGNNNLHGWQNYDTEIDIENPLPFSDNSVDFILAEHVVEHVDYYKAIDFLRECARILKPGGIVRVAVPSVEQIMQQATPEYCQFVTRWVKEDDPSVRGAMKNILYCHGHKAPWTKSLLETTLYFVGFKGMRFCAPGDSAYPELLNVEGHGKVIGDEWNRIETIVCEAMAEK